MHLKALYIDSFSDCQLDADMAGHYNKPVLQSAVMREL